MRLFTVTLAYAPARTLIAGLDRYYDTTANPGRRHILIDQHYPLNSGAINLVIEEMCRRYRIEYVDPRKNLGYHGGFNFAMEHLDKEMSDDDAILCYDPDAWPDEKRWDTALEDAFDTCPDMATCGVLNPRSRKEISDRGYTDRGSVWITHKPIVASLQAWRKGFIRKAGGFKEPRPYYGGIEAEMWPRLQEQGKTWGMLSKFNEIEILRDWKDPEYRAWQWAHAHETSFQGDFAAFVAAGCPTRGPVPARIP
jgi:hypothetical protein